MKTYEKLKAVPHGLNLRDALRLASEMGVSGKTIPRSGELVFHHGEHHVRVDLCRKDATRPLILLLNSRLAEIRRAS